MLKKQIAREKRHNRIRYKVKGTEEKPRLVVFRSLLHIYAHLIDDETGKTLLTISDMKEAKGNKIERATNVGKSIGQKAAEMKITACVFDRNGYKYHGRVKAVAEGARAEGLQF